MNVFELLIVYNLLNNMDMMECGFNIFCVKCIDGIMVNEEVCKKFVENFIGIVIVFLLLIGYKKFLVVVKEVLVIG